MGKGIVKLGEGQWAVKDGNLLAAKETNGRFKNTEFTVSRGTRASYVGRDGLIKESNLQDVNLVNNGDFSELSSELITNGTFDTDSDWSKTQSGNDTIVIENGYALFNCPDNSNIFITQPSVMTVGKTYTASFDIISIDSGGFQFGSGGGGTISGSPTANTVGTHTFTFVATTASFVIKRALGSPNLLNGKIDNVSVKEVDPNDYWTFSGDSFTFPDGAARIARTTSTTFIQQNVLTSGKLYKVEFDVLDKDDNNGTFIVRLGSNNVYDVSTYEGTRFSKYITSAGIDFRIYSSSDNGVIYVDNIVVSEVKTDTPRIDFTDNTDGHLLLEPQSTNLVTYSEDFSGWTYVSPTSSITVNNAVSPDGTSNADTISYVGGAGNDYAYYNGGFTTTSASTFSVYARTTVGTKNIALRTWNTGIYETKTITTEWQRFTLSISSNLSSEKIGLDNRTTYGGSGTSGDIEVWGAQLEALSYPTSYIPTDGSTVTRDADTCTGAGSSADFNSEEGVLYLEVAALNDDISQQIGVYGGSSTEQLRIEIANSVIRAQLFNGAYQANMSSTQTVTNFNKIAFKWKVDDFALWVNGSEIQTDSSGTTFSAATLDNINFSAQNGTSSAAQAKVKAVRVYKEALSDTDLQNLTS